MLRMTDQLNEKNKKKKNTYYEPDEVEITMSREMSEPINLESSVFDKGSIYKTPGINTAPSAFEKGTIFKTSLD